MNFLNLPRSLVQILPVSQEAIHVCHLPLKVVLVLLLVKEKLTSCQVQVDIKNTRTLQVALDSHKLQVEI